MRSFWLPSALIGAVALFSLQHQFTNTRPIPPGMVEISGGWFMMGEDNAFPEEAPRHRVYVDTFYMMTHEVTNREFAQFVADQMYVTTAERAGPDGAPSGSAVLMAPRKTADRLLTGWRGWWRMVPGANWRHPLGPGSSITNKDEHPVVHVSFFDAEAYCRWRGGRLPTEAEWERAAWGRAPELIPSVHQGHSETQLNANIWTGDFPYVNNRLDGWIHTAPVGSYPSNSYGLFDMLGNVWEWTSDWYRVDYYKHSTQLNPKGPDKVRAFDSKEPGVAKKTTRGGSFACADNYCSRYRPSARSATTPDTSLSHTGFRCVVST